MTKYKQFASPIPRFDLWVDRKHVARGTEEAINAVWSLFAAPSYMTPEGNPPATEKQWKLHDQLFAEWKEGRCPYPCCNSVYDIARKRRDEIMGSRAVVLFIKLPRRNQVERFRIQPGFNGDFESVRIKTQFTKNEFVFGLGFFSHVISLLNRIAHPSTTVPSAREYSFG